MKRRNGLAAAPPALIDHAFGADEKNRTSTPLREQASETCASTSSATSARVELLRILGTLANFKGIEASCGAGFAILENSC